MAAFGLTANLAPAANFTSHFAKACEEQVPASSSRRLTDQLLSLLRQSASRQMGPAARPCDSLPVELAYLAFRFEPARDNSRMVGHSEVVLRPDLPEWAFDHTVGNVEVARHDSSGNIDT